MSLPFIDEVRHRDIKWVPILPRPQPSLLTCHPWGFLFFLLFKKFFAEFIALLILLYVTFRFCFGFLVAKHVGS